MRLVLASPRLCVALVFVSFCQVSGGAADSTDPLRLFDGVYAGTIRWPAHFDQQLITNPVWRGEEAPFRLVLTRTQQRAKLRWTFAGETSEAWIVGTIGERVYAAPRDTGMQCHPYRHLRERAARDHDLWLACRSVDASSSLPAVLMELTAVVKTRDASAAALRLTFKQYLRWDRLARLDDATALMLQLEDSGDGERLLLRSATGILFRQIR